MDDKELEARLSTRLHERFDSAPVPARLGVEVQRAMDNHARPVRFMVRPGRAHLGWLAAAAAIAVVALALASLRLPLGPGGGTASPGASAGSSAPMPSVVETPDGVPSSAPDLVFVVMPAPKANVGRDLLARVGAQLADRVTAVGGTVDGWAASTFLEYTVGAEGAGSGDIRDVLSVVGDVQFVGLPASDYGTGRLQASPGSPLPKAEPALFGWEGIASAVRTDGELGPTAALMLAPEAADVFGAWTTNHVGDQVAIVVDGIVGITVRINEPVTGGQVQLLSGSENAGLFSRTTAILVGGQLPSGWASPTAIMVLSRDDAIRAAQHLHPGDVGGAGVDVLTDGAFPRAVWRVGFMDGTEVTIDAVTADWISTDIS